MNNTSILMPSVTHAMKAKRLFTSMGYRCGIKRSVSVSRNGCTHYITVNTTPERAKEILDKNNVRYGAVIREDDGS